MRKFRIIIAGSREFSTEENYRLMRESMDVIIVKLKLSDEEKKELTIVSGCAKGADTLGERYAEECGYQCTRFPADWEKYGNAAGFMRNAKMAIYSTDPGYTGILAAFWNGTSRGTKHMIETAKRYMNDDNVNVISF